MNLEIREVDYANPDHCAGIVSILDSYASDPVGGGQPLCEEVKRRVVSTLHEHPSALVLLALAEHKPVGIAVCFLGLSTFQARPLLNLHDLAVLPEYRGRGLGRALLHAVEQSANQRDCGKLTLEVQDDNVRARKLYKDFGFGDFILGDSAATRFLSKPLK